MAACRTDTQEQTAQICALRGQTDRFFLHYVVTAFTDRDMCLVGSHEKYDMPILLPSDWDNPETGAGLSCSGSSVVAEQTEE